MELMYPWIVWFGAICSIAYVFDGIGLFRTVGLELPPRKMGLSVARWPILVMLSVGLGLISYGAGIPRKSLKVIPGTVEVNDIFLVLDVSRSMLADDLRPNRLEVAKQKLADFAKLRPKDRIGVIMFSEKVFTLLPLTTDSGLIQQVIGDIRVGVLGAGTNIGDALALAVARGQASETKNKSIILLTDGVSNVDSMTPMQAAELAKKYGMKVYTIGLGSDRNARIPTPGGFGSQIIPGGSIDMKTLHNISKTTGGKSFRASDSGALKDILGEIDRLERSEIKSTGRTLYAYYHYWYFLFGGILFVLSEFLRRFWLRELV